MKKLLFAILPALIITACGKDSSSASDLAPSTGQGGSLARFAIVDDHLYAVNGTNLKAFDISNVEKPVYQSNHSVGVEVETIFAREDKTLFIGSTQGMYIYGIDDNTGRPDYISHYEHIVSCDPVVADDSYAYVTLRSSVGATACNRGINQLDIIDIKNLSTPQWINSVQMTHPIGLAIYGDTLLVCDNGIKVLDVSQPNHVKELNTLPNIDAVDIIPLGDVMLVAGSSGLSQYRYKNRQFTFLSEIK